MTTYTITLTEHKEEEGDQFAIFENEEMYADNCSFAYGVDRCDIITEIEHFRKHSSTEYTMFIAEQFTFPDDEV